MVGLYIAVKGGVLCVVKTLEPHLCKNRSGFFSPLYTSDSLLNFFHGGLAIERRFAAIFFSFAICSALFSGGAAGRGGA